MKPSEALSGLALLDSSHDLDSFQCAKPEVDRWLRTIARHAVAVGSATTYVVCDPPTGETVIGFYALSISALAAGTGPSRLSAGLGQLAIPVVRLAWLGVDQKFAKQGLGEALLVDACRRSMRIGREIAFRGVVIDAVDDDVASWYERYGFRRLMHDSRTLYALQKDLRKGLGDDPPAPLREL